MSPNTEANSVTGTCAIQVDCIALHGEHIQSDWHRRTRMQV